MKKQKHLRYIGDRRIKRSVRLPNSDEIAVSFVHQDGQPKTVTMKLSDYLSKVRRVPA